ncbi:MAG: nucleotide sugar dehydrogenase [Alphaproteobacteria bacterium]|nr:nucleotide sugar dehydrogenase [Alphaproteobacteria bacterium]
MAQLQKVAVIGLGYVGLPLAVALAKSQAVTGFDINVERVSELRAGHDRTNELTSDDLKASDLAVTSDPSDIQGCDIYIVAVPTPVDEAKNPDLAAVTGASTLVGDVMAKGAIVVFESTVYPGVTEDVCGPALEAASNLECGKDFYLGYSPERINPGDKVHTVDKITKVVAGQTPEVAEILTKLYGAMNNGDIFVAKSIRAAEAAKVIENSQRDINIAFINEVAMIFDRMGLPVQDVLEAAGTKWNFLKFSPGLVGGHCIGVDPFYLAHAAKAHGHDPEIILAGRRINDGMSAYITERVHELLDNRQSDILVLGLTFKENVPDLRNSQVRSIVDGLAALGHRVQVHDPLADPVEADRHYGITLQKSLSDDYDCIIGAVAHDEYKNITPENLIKPGGLIADLKAIWPDAATSDVCRYWSL